MVEEPFYGIDIKCCDTQGLKLLLVKALKLLNVVIKLLIVTYVTIGS